MQARRAAVGEPNRVAAGRLQVYVLIAVMLARRRVVAAWVSGGARASASTTQERRGLALGASSGGTLAGDGGTTAGVAHLLGRVNRAGRSRGSRLRRTVWPAMEGSANEATGCVPAGGLAMRARLRELCRRRLRHQLPLAPAFGPLPLPPAPPLPMPQKHFTGCRLVDRRPSRGDPPSPAHTHAWPLTSRPPRGQRRPCHRIVGCAILHLVLPGGRRPIGPSPAHAAMAHAIGRRHRIGCAMLHFVFSHRSGGC